MSALTSAAIAFWFRTSVNYRDVARKVLLHGAISDQIGTGRITNRKIGHRADSMPWTVLSSE